MATTTVTVSLGHKVKTFCLPGRTITIGRDPNCELYLPFPWIAERHIRVELDAGLNRIKAATSGASGTVNGHPLSREWQLLPPNGVVQIASPKGPMEIRFSVSSIVDGGTLVCDDTEKQSSHVPIIAEFAGVSPIDESASLFKPVENQSPRPQRPHGKTARLPSRRVLAASLTLLTALALIIGAAVFKDLRQRGAVKQLITERNRIEAEISEAREHLRQNRYTQAKALLETARAHSLPRPQFAVYVQEIDTISNRPEIRLGANGYVKFEGTWILSETVSAERAVRERDDPGIRSLKSKAQSAFTSGDFETGRRYCDDALAMLASHPIQPVPGSEEISKLRAQIQNQIVAAEMTAKGLVLFEEQWITPAEQFWREQWAKGLVEYRGKWMTKDAAFAAEQTDKGLVLHNGKWMTPDQQMLAKGFVKFEGKWVTPEEKRQVLAEREATERAEQERIAAEKRRLDTLAEASRQENERIERLRPSAFLMSQEFVKDQLKSPASARFPDAGDRKVIVVFKDGWFIVSAYVDAQNGFGAMLRNAYLCKLRPIANDRWEAESTFLLN